MAWVGSIRRPTSRSSTPSSGALYFDPDGTGAAAMVQFATLEPHVALSASDFVLV